MIDFTCPECGDPNFIAAELADDVRAAARSLGQFPQAALEHRLGWRALAPLKAAVRRSHQPAEGREASVVGCGR